MATAQDAPPPPLVDVAPLAEADRSVTLEQAFRLARDEASDMRLAELAVSRARAAERTALAALLPTVNAGLTFTQWNQAVERSGLVVRPETQYGGNVQVAESLSLRGYNGTRIASQNTRVARHQLADARRVLLAAVARAFFGELSAQKNAALARSQLASAETQHRAVLARVAAGVALSIDAARSELAMLEAARRVADVDASLGRARDLLGAALGLDVTVSAEEAPLPETGESLDAYIERAHEGRADIRAARASRDLAELSVDDAWFRFVPALGVTWTLSWTPQTTFQQPDPVQWVGIATLSFPLYDGGARYGALGESHAAVAQAEERIRALSRSVRLEVRDAFRRVDTARRALELARRGGEVARLAQERAQAAYASGALTGLELDDARRAAEEAEIGVLLRVLEHQLAVVDLLTFSGTLERVAR